MLLDIILINSKDKINMTTQTKSYLERQLDFNEFDEHDFDDFKRELTTHLIVDERETHDSDDYDNWFHFGDLNLQDTQALISKHGIDKAKELIIKEVSKVFDRLTR